MKKRSQILEEIKSREFDLIIIGGGVVGAGVAQDAASRGLSVLLVEKDDFSSGTSSRTTKLIHGGLRYLEQMQFRLTRELCQERGLLEQLAPHMVKDFSFVLPISSGNRFFGLKAEVGLSVYDILSINARGVRRHERLGKKATLAAAPSLSDKRVTASLRFHDCITDDSRIVIEVLKSATNRGALAINYMEAIDFVSSDGLISSVTCQDRVSGEKLTIKSRSCVNAAGVWSDKLLKQIDPDWKDKVKPAKGTHIMLPLSSFETTTALFLPTPDGRYVFVVPWQKALMVGTTDTEYEGPLDNPLPTAQEIDYLLGILNSYNKAKDTSRAVCRDDVIAAWSGLRPLVSATEEDGKTSNLSREHLLFTGPSGIIGLIGGKLTNYRILSIHITDMVLDQLNRRQAATFDAAKIGPPCTDKIMLGNWDNHSDYLTSSAQISSRGRKLGLDPATIDHITATFGKDALTVLDIAEANPSLVERICPDFPPILAEIPFVVENEMALSLEDILSRRIRLGFVHQGQCMAAAPKVAEIVANIAGWDAGRINIELGHLEASLMSQLAPAH